MKKIDLMKYSIWIGLGLSFISSFLFSLTPVWQLTFVAGIFGGLMSRKRKSALFSSVIGVLLGWGLSISLGILSQHTIILLDQIAELIFGSSSLGYLIIIGILVIGLLMGALGGLIGNSIRLFMFRKDE